jgi:hypothetical protein
MKGKSSRNTARTQRAGDSASPEGRPARMALQRDGIKQKRVFVR